MSFKVWTLSAVVFALLAAPAPAMAKRRNNFAGPVSARVLEVLDGDTLLAEAEIWPGQTLRVNIRIRGIDAPEMKSRCRAEREAGAISLSNIGGAKYYGRVLADVATEAGETVATVMLDQGLARPYGGGKRQGWCG